MGTGIGRGENRALEAAQQAISSPLLDNVSIAGATGVLINIIGGDDLTLGEATTDHRDRPRRGGRRCRDHLRRRQRPRDAGRDPGHRHRDRLRPADNRASPARPSGVISFPGRKRASARRGRRRAPTACGPPPPPARCSPMRQQPAPGPTCPTWKSRRSSVGRWIDAAPIPGCRRARTGVRPRRTPVAGFALRRSPVGAAGRFRAPDSTSHIIEIVPTRCARGETLAHLLRPATA